MIRRLAWFAFSFAAGTALALMLFPFSWLPYAAGAAALLSLLSLTQKDPKNRLRVRLALLGAAAGLIYYFAFASFVQVPAQELSGTTQKTELTVTDYAEKKQGDGWGIESGYRIRVKLNEGKHGISAYLYSDDYLLTLQPGDRITGTMSLRSAAYMEGSPVTTFTSKGIFLLAIPQGEQLVKPGNARDLRYIPQRLARAVEASLSEQFSGDTEALMRAMITGDKSGFSEEMYTVLAEAGILHIAAVSGLHCAFILSMLSLLIGNRRRVLAASAIPLLILYALMVGGSASVVRAVTMMIFILLAPLLRREEDSPTMLAAALLLILLNNPFAIAGEGLQLSFCSIAGIIWIAPKVYDALTRRHEGRIWRFIATSVATTFGVMIFTVPLCAVYFGDLVLISPLTNLLCLGMTSVTFGCALVSAGLGLLWQPLAFLPAAAAKGGAWYLLSVCRLLIRVPYHAVYFNSIYLVCWLFFAYGLIFFCRRGGLRRVLTAVCCCALTLVLSVGLARLDYRYGDLNIHVLDVGQGQCILLTSGSKTAVIDCGSSNTYINAGDIASDVLLSTGTQKVDYLILTHYHADHTDGLPALFSRIHIETLILPPEQPEDEICEAILRLAKEYGTDIRFLKSEKTFLFGKARFRILAPVYGLCGEDENENGLSVLCSVGAFDFLVTGDMNAATEEALCRQAFLPDVEVMMVGHHGSRYSSGAAFLSVVRPEIGIISVGDNSYGHPAPESLERYCDVGAVLHRTDFEGDIRITVD